MEHCRLSEKPILFTNVLSGRKSVVLIWSGLHVTPEPLQCGWLLKCPQKWPNKHSVQGQLGMGNKCWPNQWHPHPIKEYFKKWGSRFENEAHKIWPLTGRWQNVSLADSMVGRKKQRLDCPLSTDGRHDVEMPALDWGGHSKKYHNTRLKSNRFIWNHELSERCPFIRWM